MTLFAYAPGTDTLEIGGLTTVQGLEFIRGCRGFDVIGANLLYEILCVLPGVAYRD
jgi:guanidinobutyrase